MKEKLQLIVVGGNWELGGQFTRVTDITQEQFDELEPVIEKVISTKPYNWVIGTDLVKVNNTPTGWKSEPKVYQMYKSVDKALMKLFLKFCPDHIDSIDEIKLQKVVVKDIKSYVR